MEKALSHIKDKTIFSRTFYLVALDKPVNVINPMSGKATHYKPGVHVVDKAHNNLPYNLKFYSTVIREWLPEEQKFKTVKSRY